MEKLQKFFNAILLLLCLVLCAALFKGYLDGEFHSVETLQRYVAGFGLLAPIILIMIQAGQVVVPVLPGFVGCAAGAALFGCMGGFWCNFIGISAGSILAFLLAKKFGRAFVSKMFPGKRYEKLSAWAAESKSYTAVLFLGMVLPLFPDDFFLLCYRTYENERKEVCNHYFVREAVVHSGVQHVVFGGGVRFWRSVGQKGAWDINL